MYAAAGGASLASRQARKKQQQQQKNKATQQHLLREKLAQVKASGVTTPTKSRGFHQLADKNYTGPGYLRPPQGTGRKLSATYTGTGGSRLLLPISEGQAGDESRSPHQSSHLLLGYTSGGPHALHKSATATIPFHHVSHEVSTPPTPNVCFADQSGDHFQYDGPNLGRYKHKAHRLHLPLINDPTILPVSPIPSPGKHQQLSPSQLERKCSVYRGRKLDPNDEHFYRTTTFQTAQELYNEEFRNYVFPPPLVPNGILSAGVDYYCTDPEHKQLGICTCEV